MIQAKFGLPDIALRTLEVYTTATLEKMLHDGDAVHARVAGDDGSPVSGWPASRTATLVYDDPRFVDYFRAATPGAGTGED